MIMQMATAPPLSQIQGEPLLNQSFIVLPQSGDYRLL